MQVSRRKFNRDMQKLMCSRQKMFKFLQVKGQFL